LPVDPITSAILLALQQWSNALISEPHQKDDGQINHDIPGLMK
jgi:hypothetical protein